MNVKSRIDELRNLLKKYNYQYYILDNPTVSDQEFDALLHELIKLEDDNPEFKSVDSPTQRIGSVVLDKFEKVTDEASAHTAREIALTEGIFAGYTSGAVMQATKQYAEAGEFDENSKVVVIFPDHGSRYMSKVYSDKWMSDQGFFDSKTATQATIEYIK